jgi:hypothetical protein
MRATVRELTGEVAGKARRRASPAAWQAAAVEAAWKLAGPCAPEHPGVALPSPLPEIRWPTQYEWPLAEGWGRPLRQGLEALTVLTPRAVSQPYQGIIVFEVAYPNEQPRSVVLDYHDHPVVNTDALADAAVYFKMQFLRGGYGDPRAVPGGYVASAGPLYEHYCRLRALRRRGSKIDVYGRFGTKFSAELRRDAVTILRGQTRFGYVGGTGIVSYMRSLREAAQARVCIDLPGNGPFCFRLVDYLAIGACVIAPKHDTMLHAELRDREHIVYCRKDLGDLTELCAEYVENEAMRTRIGENAARFFDEHLHPRQLAGYYLRTLDERLAPGRATAHG